MQKVQLDWFISYGVRYWKIGLIVLEDAFKQLDQGGKKVSEGIEALLITNDIQWYLMVLDVETDDAKTLQ